MTQLRVQIDRLVLDGASEHCATALPHLLEPRLADLLIGRTGTPSASAIEHTADQLAQRIWSEIAGVLR